MTLRYDSEDAMRTYLVLHTLNTTPCTHNERVVRSDDGDYVDTLRLELVVLVDEAREVADMACWLDSWSTINKTVRVGAYMRMQLTVNAPGTENKTTFLPFHSLVESWMAIIHRTSTKLPRVDCRPLTNTTSELIEPDRQSL